MLSRTRRRFDEILASVGTTPAMLTKRLRGLVAEGVLEQRLYQERPRRYEYHLTDKGRELFDVIVPLMRWGDRHYGPPPRLLVHDNCGQPLDPYIACAHCGQPVHADVVDPQPGPGARSGM